MPLPDHHPIPPDAADGPCTSARSRQAYQLGLLPEGDLPGGAARHEGGRLMTARELARRFGQPARRARLMTSQDLLQRFGTQRTRRPVP